MNDFTVAELIEKGEYEALENLLKESPELANIYVHFGPEGKNAVHPLHFACDCVFEYKIVEIVALQIIKTLINAGADVNGNATDFKDSPLIAAISLYCDQIALFLLNQQHVNMVHRGTHGGTALHWAAWIGSDITAEILIKKETDLNRIDNEFGATPLHWAVNGLINTSLRNKRNQLKVLKLLLEAGADPLITDNNNKTPYEVAVKAELKDVIELFVYKK